MSLDLSKITGAVTTSTVPDVAPVAPAVTPTPKKFLVELEGEPEALIEDCVDRMDAQEKYNKLMGINSSTRKYSYTEVE